MFARLKKKEIVNRLFFVFEYTPVVRRKHTLRPDQPYKLNAERRIGGPQKSLRVTCVTVLRLNSVSSFPLHPCDVHDIEHKTQSSHASTNLPSAPMRCARHRAQDSIFTWSSEPSLCTLRSNTEHGQRGPPEKGPPKSKRGYTRADGRTSLNLNPHTGQTVERIIFQIISKQIIA